MSELNLALQLQDSLHGHFTPMSISAPYRMWLMRRLWSKECRPSALSEAVLFHHQFPDRQRCLSDERTGHFTIIPGLAIWELSCLKWHGFRFLPSSRTSTFLGWCYAVLFLPNYFPQNWSGRQHQVLLLSSPFLCKQRSKETSQIRDATWLKSAERAQNREDEEECSEGNHSLLWLP